MPVSALIFLIALFAETNRQPFDTVESEADLVGSFHTEYGAFKWGLFFVAEYSHMVIGFGGVHAAFLRRLESAAVDAVGEPGELAARGHRLGVHA